jgi:uncharacterized protein (TIGR02687 family)
MTAMHDRIRAGLERLFQQHRVVFWYDAKRELREAYESVALDGVEKIEPRGREFGLKHRMLREAPQQRFLLYVEGPPPEDRENWLLDVELAHGVFRTDQTAVWLAELGLGLEFGPLVDEHTEFFRAARRRESLHALIEERESRRSLRLKLCAVCAASEPRLDSVLEHLLQELTEGGEARVRLLERCGLSEFLWDELERAFGYRSDAPGLRDFAVELFKSTHAAGTDGIPALNAEARVFLNRWKDSRTFHGAFEALSQECAEVLGIEQDVAGRNLADLVELDHFRVIDQRLVHGLAAAVAGRTLPADQVAAWVRRRRMTHWFPEFEHLYEAVDAGAQFLAVLGEAHLVATGVAEGVERYATSWYRVDQLYRRFVHHARRSNQPSVLGALADEIENRYVNGFLVPVNNAWSGAIEAAGAWKAAAVTLQRDLFARKVQPVLSRGHKICVVASDALRYEVADELLGRIRQEDRYLADLAPALAMLPSYTQLGMAALLPNRELRIAGDDSGTVFVDGRDSRGLANRKKILEAEAGVRVTAARAEEFLALQKRDARALLRDHDLVFIYHNRIDAVGDTRDTEERVFEAADEAVHELVTLVKKLYGANATNVLVTADHGFLFQRRALDDADFSSCQVEGDEILVRDRRFVLGHGLRRADGLLHFDSEAVGLTGDVEVAIPRSINRLRQKGSGSRYVHGGASLQEVVIPVLSISKTRQSDVIPVEVEILKGATSMITAGQLSVSFYQAQGVTDKVRPRVLRAGIYTESGALISDRHDLVFDVESDDARERETRVQFVLGREADEANGQEVLLKLEERHEGTSHFREYKTARYLLRRSFTSDFDF